MYKYKQTMVAYMVASSLSQSEPVSLKQWLH